MGIPIVEGNTQVVLLGTTTVSVNHVRYGTYVRHVVHIRHVMPGTPGRAAAGGTVTSVSAAPARGHLCAPSDMRELVATVELAEPHDRRYGAGRIPASCEASTFTRS